MWYVIHTISGMEQKCKQQCEQYVDASAYKRMFVLQYIAKRHFKKEWHEVKKVLFPGYLFVDTETIEPIMEGLRQFQQYTRVLRDGEMVSPVTEQEQKFLADMMDEEYVVQYSEGFLIGEEVYITSGPLRNYQGCIRTVDRHRRIAKLEIPVFGGPTPVEVGFGAIARVNQDEFRRMKNENIRRQKQETMIKDVSEQHERIRVRSGIFAGMEGKLLCGNARSVECTVLMELFDVGMKVVFRQEEIECLP